LLVALAAGWAWRVENARRREAEYQENSNRLQKAADVAHARFEWTLRKAQLDVQSKGDGLSPDEAVELRMLREMDAKGRIDELGREK
jgi:hypothetical protein